jgi:hypothetical protein
MLMAAALGLGASLPALPVAGDEPGAAAQRVLAAPGDPAWRPIEFPKVPAHTRYEVERVEGRAVWKATSECSASGMLLPLADIDLRRTPLLSWSWRVVAGPMPSDERTRQGDDFAARVYVLFPFESDGAPFWQIAARRLVERVYGRELPGPTLNYVWTFRVGQGERWPNPSTDSARMIALRSQGRASRGWRSELVDVASDRSELSPQPHRPPIALAIMSDTDDTCSHAEAWFADFRFTGERPARRDADSPAEKREAGAE